MKIYFVGDFIYPEITGGAELTSDVFAKETSEYCETEQIKASDFLRLKEILESEEDKYFVVGNYAHWINHPEFMMYFFQNARYSLIEYDYKYCHFRSEQLHKEKTKRDCDCNKSQRGQNVENFMLGADALFFMSKMQSEIFLERFPSLRVKNIKIPGSVFHAETVEKIVELSKNKKSNKWAVVKSDSWVKGFENSLQVAESRKIAESDFEYEVLENCDYDQFLNKLSGYKGLVYHPSGADTCPRLVIEAKYLGLELDIGEFVQNKHELTTSSYFEEEGEEVGYQFEQRNSANINRLVSEVVKFALCETTIGSYFTTYNCIKSKYPFEDSIRSVMSFSDEISVVDGFSDDGTLQKLFNLAEEFTGQKLEPLNTKFIPEILNFYGKDGKRFVIQVKKQTTEMSTLGIQDGQRKALARKVCNSDFVWQMDVDEVVPKECNQNVLHLKKFFPKVPIASLPVLEFWGDDDKLRIDITPWKWRMSINSEFITHGPPLGYEVLNDMGMLVGVKPGTDGCDMIFSDTKLPVQHMSFYSSALHALREQALSGSEPALEEYTNYMSLVCNELPYVLHYSWIDIPRKIRNYRDFWSKFWPSLYRTSSDDTAENNVFFDKPWSEVSEEDITIRSAELLESGGHIFHKKWDGKKNQTMSYRNLLQLKNKNSKIENYEEDKHSNDW